jgi:hypothetical protein
VKRYVTVKLTPKMAFAVASAAESELLQRDASNDSHGDEYMIREGVKRLYNAWREAIR